MINKNKKFLFFFVFILFSFFVSKNTAFASTTINFSPETGLYMIGDTIKVKIVVSSDISINAASAKIKFPTDLLSLTSISKTGSIISLWAQEPTYSNSSGTANIEGVILSGYSGNSGVAATLIFKAKSIGKAKLSFENASVFANDGKGTDVASGKGGSSLTIIKNKNEVPPPVITKEDTNITISELKDNILDYSKNKFFITTSVPVKDNLFYIQIDALSPIIWTDDGSHIYEVSNLLQGDHSVKIMAIDKSLNILNGFLNFSTKVLRVPVLTYYVRDVFPDEFIILKGLADPLVDVEVTITNKSTNEKIISHVQTNNEGNFTYVPENKLAIGTYSVTARALTGDGVFSGYMQPVEIMNQQHLFNIFITRINNYLTLIVPLALLLVLFIFIILYGIYRIKKFKIRLKKKLLDAENSLAKDFKTLEEDVDKENLILKKVRENKPLIDGENTFMDKFKQDIETTMGTMAKEVKDLDK